MSKYTTELRFICNQLANRTDLDDYSEIADTIETARPKIFSFDYPIFNALYKPVLETKILRHYYTNEIGQETYGLWKFRLETKLNEIMPYYNKMYESAEWEYNPLYTVDYRKEHEGEGTNKGTDNRESDFTAKNTGTQTTGGSNTGTVTTERNGDNWSKFSDTPQGTLTNVKNDSYLTTATENTVDETDTVTNNLQDNHTTTNNLTNTNKGTDKLNRNFKTTDQYIEHIYGNMGSNYAKLIQDYRDTLLNIDLMIIHDLRDLFMLVY